MRIAFSVILAVLVAALLYCSVIARRSTKDIGKPVAHLLLALLPPLIGNLILIASTNQALSTVGCYIYYIGMDLVMFALLRFTVAYCSLSGPPAIRIITNALLVLDALQILANIFTGHAFGVEETLAYGAPYYRLVPYIGQGIHRVLDYTIILSVLVVFFVKTIRAPRVSSERYSVILACMVITTAWQSVYIFSRTPVDRSMIGFGVFGLLVFYFALYYRPYRLLDRMLVAMASEIPDALFFFDVHGSCVWVNKRGIVLAGKDGGDYETAARGVRELLGVEGDGGPDASWAGEHIIGDGDLMQSYIASYREVTDDKNKVIGSFLALRDNSDEKRVLQREMYKATHDSLTDLYNRAGYDVLLASIDLPSTLMIIVDGDEFKLINDEYGHEVGDRILQKIASSTKHHFRSDDVVCRYGGDEFVVMMGHATPAQFALVRDRIRRINDDLADTADGLPQTSVSAGCAHGAGASDGAELFEQADKALYDAKRNGRRNVAFFSAQSDADAERERS